MQTNLIVFAHRSGLRYFMGRVLTGAGAAVREAQNLIEYVDGTKTYLKVITGEKDYEQIAGMRFDSITFDNGVSVSAEVKRMLERQLTYSAQLSSADISAFRQAQPLSR